MARGLKMASVSRRKSSSADPRHVADRERDQNTWTR